MKCPSCSLENPPTAIRCDCGYQFTPGQGRPNIPAAESKSLKKITVLLISILVINCAALAIQLFSPIQKRVQWEYQVIGPKDAELQKTLQMMGDQGWDIASMRRAISRTGSESEGIYEIIAKRQK